MYPDAKRQELATYLPLFMRRYAAFSSANMRQGMPPLSALCVAWTSDLPPHSCAGH